MAMWMHKISPHPRHAYLARELASRFYKCGEGCNADPTVAADMLLFYSPEGGCADVAKLPTDRVFGSPCVPAAPHIVLSDTPMTAFGFWTGTTLTQ